jgi:hypothetical protein
VPLCKSCHKRIHIEFEKMMEEIEIATKSSCISQPCLYKLTYPQADCHTCKVLRNCDLGNIYQWTLGLIDPRLEEKFLERFINDLYLPFLIKRKETNTKNYLAGY